ncbi:hypothetical protein [Cylindrospermopsis raciborskii]|uniref:hypothetical protein n=1 Tax=Cylindrospermopsis raciborskii TaxID=77022 RepID=UPI0015C4B1F7|nr:hypothetical protein [Cylindrospermopsis raciborskii]
MLIILIFAYLRSRAIAWNPIPIPLRRLNTKCDRIGLAPGRSPFLTTQGVAPARDDV